MSDRLSSFSRGSRLGLGLMIAAGTLAAQTLVDTGATWQYWTGTREASSPTSAWRQPGFDDAAWPDGPAPFRYGDGAGAHLVEGANVLSAQVFNATLNSSDCLFDFRLQGTLPDPVLPQTKDTQFSAKRGFYESNVTVAVSSATFGATITYTLDGSDPRTSASARSGPTPVSVSIDPASTYGGRRPHRTPAVALRAYASCPGHLPSDVDTQTYLFLDHVRTQGNIVPSGSYVFWDTVMDPRVVNDARYSSIFRAALQDIPTLSIVMDWEDLFGTGGIHRGNNLNNDSLAKPCSIELIYPPLAKFAGLAGFQVNGGIQIQGGGGRWDEGRFDPKQSFTLLFQPLWEGPGRLQYPLFEAAPLNRETDVGEYNRVILRAGHNKSWPGPGPNLRETTVYTRDEYFRASHLALSGQGGSPHGTFVHLYLNGLYWGLYNPVERPDHAFLSIHFGGESEHYDSYKERSGDPNGDRDRLAAAQSVVSHPATPYATVQEYVDTAQFIDFLIVTWSGGAADGPQWYAGNARNPAGPIRWFCWDYEDSFTPPGTGRGDAGYTWMDDNPLWTSIRNHPEFKMELADRLYRHCCNDGEFTDTRNTHRWLTLVAHLEKAIIGESARWGDQGPSSRGGPDLSGYTAPLNRNDHWYKARDQVTAMLLGNTDKMIGDLRARGYFPSVQAKAPLFFDAANQEIRVSRLEFTNSTSVRLTRDGTTGTIYFTVNGPDPRAEGGAVQGLNGGSGTNLILTDTATLRARVLHGTEWSPVHVLTLHAADHDLSALKITELMYHPRSTELAANRPVSMILGNAGGADEGRALIQLAANAPGAPYSAGDDLDLGGAALPANHGSYTVHRVSGRDVYLTETLLDESPSAATASLSLDGDRYEFLELKNTGATPLNLSGVRCTAGIQYEFPEGTLLEPGQFWLLTPHRSNFRDRQPAVPVQGCYRGGLDNSGERVTVRDHLDRILTTVRHGDRAPWPVAPDGWGYSLVPVQPNPTGEVDDVTQWRPSLNEGGSPGADDPVATVPPIKINEVLTHTDPPWVDAVELYNPTAQAVNLGGWYLTDDRSQPRRWRIPDNTLLPSAGYLVLQEGHYVETELRQAAHEFGSDFALSALGEEIYLFSPTLGYSHGFQFAAAFNGVSFGRHVTSTGEEHFPSQVARTLGGPNSGPETGPVVISEIHYHPAEGGDEFVELHNLTSLPVPLHDPAHPTQTWQLAGLSFAFAAENVTIPPHGFLLLVCGEETTPAAFRAKYGVPDGVPILPDSGTLDSNGETLTLLRPDEPVASGPEAGIVPYVVVDRVRYSPQPPWPREAAGLGPSLERVILEGYGNDPLNWRASEVPHGTPGAVGEPPATPLIATELRAMTLTTAVGTNPGLEGFDVWNSGIGTLDYDLVADSPRVTITPHTGTSVGAGDRHRHNLEVDTTGLPQGEHTFAIEVQDNGSGAANSPVHVTLTLQLVAPPAPEIGLSVGTLTVRTRVGQNPAPATLGVFNAGTGQLHYTLGSDASWVSATPALGSSSSPAEVGQHTVNFNTAALPVGAYAARLKVTASGAPLPKAYVWVILEVLAGAEFTAYNDLSWGAGQTATHITTHTTVAGGGGGSGGGELVDFATGLPTGIVLEITGGSWLGGPHLAQGRDSHPGTEAFQIFDGKVDCRGVLSYADTELVLTLSNLGPEAVYEVVLYGNRDQYPDQFTTVTLEGAAGFTNRSSSGTVISGPGGATTRLPFGQNTAAGQIARYTNLVPGPTGRIAFRIPAATGADPMRYYLNALCLRASGFAPPRLRLQPVAEGWLMLSWDESRTLEEAPTLSGPWTPFPNLASPALVPATASTRFYRLR